VPHAYVRAVQRLTQLRHISAFYKPPAASRFDVSELHSCGQYTKVPPEQRLVDVEDDLWLHLEKAKRLHFPRRDGSQRVQPHLRECAHAIAALGDDLESARRRYIAEYEEALAELSSLDEHIGSFAPPGTPCRVRLASMGAALEPCRWPDRFILTDMLNGMAQFGNGYEDKSAVRDSHLFVPRPKNADYSVSELLSGHARPRIAKWIDGKLVHTRGDAHASSTEWYSRCTRRVESEARNLLSNAGITEEEAARARQAELSGDREAVPALLARATTGQSRLKQLFLCESMSHEESLTIDKKGGASRPPLMTAPMTHAQYERWAKSRGGIGGQRVNRRHVITRGFKEDGITPKYRCIDDLRRGGGNGTVTTFEYADLPSMLVCIWLTCILAQCWVASGKPLSSLHPTTGADDQGMAYRTILTAPSPMLDVVCYYSFRLKSMVTQRAFGHLFGSRAGSSNYSRFPRAVCFVCTSYMLVMLTHYIDDLLNTDRRAGGTSAQDALRATFHSFGADVELSKRQLNAERCVQLGGSIDLSHVSARGIAICEPVSTKVAHLMTQLATAETAGKITAAEADNVHGKCRWLTSQHRMRAGTAALQPFLQRARGLDANNSWTASMSESREFLELIFSDEFVQRLEIDVMQPTSDERDVLIIYSDCSEEDEGALHGRRTQRQAIFAYDQRDGSCHSAHCEVSAEYIEQHFSERKTYIGVGEEAEAVAAL
jgi:hypothetical protein